MCGKRHEQISYATGKRFVDLQEQHAADDSQVNELTKKLAGARAILREIVRKWECGEWVKKTLDQSFDGMDTHPAEVAVCVSHYMYEKAKEVCDV